MKNKYLKFVMLLLLPLSIGCGTNNSEKKLVTKVSDTFQYDLKNLNAVVILPNQGCQGCITEVESFMVNNANKELGIKYVLTKIMSRKILRQKIGDSIYLSKSVFIDSLNIFSSVGNKNSIYPAILYLENGRFKSIEFQSPNNPNAMNDLLKKIKRKD